MPTNKKFVLSKKQSNGCAWESNETYLCKVSFTKLTGEFFGNLGFSQFLNFFSKLQHITFGTFSHILGAKYCWQEFAK